MRRPSALSQSLLQGGGEHVDGNRGEAARLQGAQHVGLDDGVRRAARVGRRYADFEAAVGPHAEMADHAEVEHRQHRNFRVRDLREDAVSRARVSGGGAVGTSACRAHRPLPGRAGMGAMQGLHLGQQVAEVLAVPALLAVPAEFEGPGRASVARR